MRGKIMVLCLLYGIVSQYTAVAQTSTDADPAKLTKYISRLFNIDQKSVSIDKIENSNLIKGAKEGTVTIGRQHGNFYLIGQKLIIGTLYDLRVDPYKETMKKITVSGRPHHGSGPVTLVEYSDFQ